MEKKWMIKNPVDPTLVEHFRSELKVDAIIAELLLQRGIDTFDAAQQFFRPSLESLHDPFLMHDLSEAANRLSQALANKEGILLFGDYDVDGTTAVALMHSFLTEHSESIDYYIPDRYTEGYGLSKKGIDSAAASGAKLIVSLDCGIRSVELIAYARELGMDFIVCDHHQPGEQLPDALVLDPKRSDCTYPYKELSGCGVAFKLLQGLCLQEGWPLESIYRFLDLVAVSIGADIVPITGENRILAHHGMRILNEFPRLSFHSLLTLAKRSFPVTLTDVVFTIAPRINAAGRLHTGRFAVELMISDDDAKVRTIASEIDTYNAERRELDSSITEEALALIEKDSSYPQRKTTVVCDASWHKGVVGIVASRLIESHFRPTIVLTESDGRLTGSARTVNDFDIYSAISRCEHLLEQFGGHTHAAGLTLKKENYVAFRDQFDTVVTETIRPEDLIPEEVIDLEINFGSIFTPLENRMQLPKLKRILRQLEPHGPGNMKPVFLSRNVFSTDVRILKEKHLKLSVTQTDTDVVLEGIAFNLGHKADEVAAGIPFEMIYTMEVNRWNGRETLQLNIKDIRAMI